MTKELSTCTEIYNQIKGLDRKAGIELLEQWTSNIIDECSSEVNSSPEPYPVTIAAILSIKELL